MARMIHLKQQINSKIKAQSVPNQTLLKKKTNLIRPIDTSTHLTLKPASFFQLILSYKILLNQWDGWEIYSLCAKGAAADGATLGQSAGQGSDGDTVFTRTGSTGWWIQSPGDGSSCCWVLDTLTQIHIRCIWVGYGLRISTWIWVGYIWIMSVCGSIRPLFVILVIKWQHN